MVCDNTINVTNGAGIAIQAMGMYTTWPAYGTRHVEDVIVAGDNEITGASRMSRSVKVRWELRFSRAEARSIAQVTKRRREDSRKDVNT